MAVNYREGYNLFASNGILFNHESPRRGETFVTRKITRAVANIIAGNQKKVYLGNLNAKRDWGFAPEYVEMMWLMLQHEKPDDYVVGTGESHSVREFVEKAFEYMGVGIEWHGEGRETIGIVGRLDSGCAKGITAGQVLVEIDPRYFRPTEVEALQADISKAREKLKWSPRVTFEDLVKIMMDYDAKLLHLDAPCQGIAMSKEKGFGYTTHDFALNQSIREL
jgi:GDPmannose 4,6-dehydratase